MTKEENTATGAIANAGRQTSYSEKLAASDAGALSAGTVNILDKYKAPVDFVTAIENSYNDIKAYLRGDVAYDPVDLIDPVLWGSWTPAQQRLAGLCLRDLSKRGRVNFPPVKCEVCGSFHWYGSTVGPDDEWCSKAPMNSAVFQERMAESQRWLEEQTSAKSRLRTPAANAR